MFRGSKGTTYEGGMRVPAIFSWPGKIKPGVISGMGSTMDIYTTVLALAGIEAGDNTDGYDISDTLFNGDSSPRLEMPYYKQGTLRAYRKGRYKIYFYGGETSNTALDEPELYDLYTDLSEKVNLAEEHPDILEDLQAAAEAHLASYTKAEPVFDMRLNGI